MMCKKPTSFPTGIAPCGQCLHCRKNKRRKKTTRIALEAKIHEHILFVTLTYDEKYLPRAVIHRKKSGDTHYAHELGTLDRRAIQLFLKKLRKKMSPEKIRVFYAGEYGERRFRPHYHLVLWGLPYSKKSYIYDSWTDPDTSELMCDPDRIDVQIPRSDWDVSQYCCAYIVKQMTKATDFRLEGRWPEFSGGSIGIGAPAVDMLVNAMLSPSAKFYIETRGDIPREIILDGKRMPIDKYLRKKILQRLAPETEVMATETAKKIFAAEMRDLQIRARETEKIASKKLVTPKQQLLLENEQKMLNAERQGDIYNATKGDF